MWRTILTFGGILAVAAFGLQWLEYQLLALGFMGLGVVISLISAALLRNSRFLPARAAA